METNKIKKNLKFDMIAYILTQAFAFFNKYIFLRFLGEELFGLNSLFTSILTLISFADLGMANVFNVFLYKPLHEHDEDAISGALKYFRNAYKLVIIVILIIGAAIIPLFPYFVNTGLEFSSVVIYYILFLIGSLTSYFSMCETSLLFADQKHFIISKYQSIALIIQNFFQFVIIALFKNYYLYLVVLICSNILNTFLIKRYVSNNYKYIKSNKNVITKEEKKNIFSNVKHMLVYKISSIILNATDNMLISAIINVASVGIYSVYMIISFTLTSLISVISNAIAAGVGNIVVSKSHDMRYYYFQKVQFVYFILAGLCCVGMMVGSNDFICMIFGEKYSMSLPILLVIVINFYILQISQPILLFKETAGLFKEIRVVNITCALMNLILSVILGRMYGLVGILGATFISKLFTTFWYESRLVFKKVFKKNVFVYYKDTLVIVLLVGIISIMNYYLNISFVDNSLINFFIKESIYCIIYVLLVVVLYRKNENFMYYKNLLLKGERKNENN